MQVKIYEAPDMTTGLKRIREELGPDALILSTRTRRDGPLGLLGKPILEITAAIDGPAGGGQAVTPDERGLLTGGGPMPKKKSRGIQANDQASGGRLDFTIGADDDLLAELSASEKNPDVSLAVASSKSSSESALKPKPTAIQPEMRLLFDELAVAAQNDAATEATPTPEAKPVVRKRGGKGGANAAKPLDKEATTASKSARRKGGANGEKTIRDERAAPVHGQPVEARTAAPVLPPPPRLLAYLRQCGIETATAESLARYAAGRLTKASEDDPLAARACLIEAVQNFISVAPPDFSNPNEQRRIALVGPTGVGKTTTIAKLAAWYMARHSGKLALITIDTYRIAAVEQLKVYGEIMRLPVEVVIDPEHLAACLDKHRDAALILIDTSGHSPQNAEAVAELGQFFTAAPAIEKHLVLSATTRENELLHSLNAFAPLAVERAIFTKIDECSNLGTLLNVQIHNAQPLSFLTNGQRVPEDLLEIDRRLVAELILSEGAARHV
ncbi:MAG: flagellar biosynthesis protein FlhF [Desulfobulbaceae bacterium]|jgi:flagellar biosynthesis protein FlhF|nr:flagellar biosynthesis protein FlhF [Desulfobulbaceae bacterium]